MSLGLLAALGAYGAVVRPWHLHWGATDDETQGPLAGDERFALVVREMSPPELLVYEFEDGGRTWAFDLREDEPGRTRLLVRNRWSSHRAPAPDRRPRLAAPAVDDGDAR